MLQKQFYSPANLTLTDLPDAVVNYATPNGGRFGFGALNGDNNPRRLQAALKIYF